MPQGYRLIDVMNETGASFARLKRWRDLGLLPKVTPKGRYTTYTQDYVDRVKQIMAIYDNNMTALDIRDRLNPADD